MEVLARFNEAAAVKPRKTTTTTEVFNATANVGFNEAAAVKPRKTSLPERIVDAIPRRFNEAAAVKPRKTIGREGAPDRLFLASMRPRR